MHGMRRLTWPMVAIALCVGAVNSGCNKSSGAEGTTAVSATAEESEPRSSRPTRGEVACRLHSCAPPYFCDESRGVCALLSCVESQDCPYGYKCDLSRNVCQ